MAIGGTSLTLSGGSYASESGWSGSGGGLSTVWAQPSYQQGLLLHNGSSTITTSMRANPDVAFDASPSSGFAIYDSYNGGSSPWYEYFGTSIATPCWAGLIAVADQIRVSAGMTTLDGPSQALPGLYALPATDFHDITSGTSTGTPNYSVDYTPTTGSSYNLVTGLGTPKANLLVPDLAMGAPQPDLTLTATHVGNFIEGDVGDTYTITVSNSGSGPTNGTASLVDTLPAGVTATAMSGTGWTVNMATLTATRNDVLAAGASYPALTVTVNVADNAAASLTNTATVAGGGEIITLNDTASDPTNVTQTPDLTVAAVHTGNFSQGDAADTYTITINNSGGASTSGSVSLVDTLPSGLTATGFTGNGWNTDLATLTASRSDVLAPGSSYPPLLLTVSVAADAPASLTNTATVSGGGEVITGNDTASDPTTINQLADLTLTPVMPATSAKAIPPTATPSR